MIGSPSGSQAGASLPRFMSKEGKTLLEVDDVLAKVGSPYSTSQDFAPPYWDKLRFEPSVEADEWCCEGPPSSSSWFVAPKGALLIAFLELEAGRVADRERADAVSQAIKQTWPECGVLDAKELRKVATQFEVLPQLDPEAGRIKHIPQVLTYGDSDGSGSSLSCEDRVGEGASTSISAPASMGGKAAESLSASAAAPSMSMGGKATEHPLSLPAKEKEGGKKIEALISLRGILVTSDPGGKTCIRLTNLFQRIGKRLDNKNNLKACMNANPQYMQRLKHHNLVFKSRTVESGSGAAAYLGTPEGTLIVIDGELARGEADEGRASKARGELLCAFEDTLDGLDINKLCDELGIHRFEEGLDAEADEPLRKKPGEPLRGDQPRAALSAPHIDNALASTALPSDRTLYYQDMGVHLMASPLGKRKRGGGGDDRADAQREGASDGGDSDDSRSHLSCKDGGGEGASTSISASTTMGGKAAESPSTSAAAPATSPHQLMGSKATESPSKDKEKMEKQGGVSFPMQIGSLLPLRGLIVTSKPDGARCIRLSGLLERIGWIHNRKDNLGSTMKANPQYMQRLKHHNLVFKSRTVESGSGAAAYLGTPEGTLIVIDGELARGEADEGRASKAREELLCAFEDTLDGLDINKLCDELGIHRFEEGLDAEADEPLRKKPGEPLRGDQRRAAALSAPTSARGDDASKADAMQTPPGLIDRQAVASAAQPPARILDYQGMGVHLLEAQRAAAHEPLSGPIVPVWGTKPSDQIQDKPQAPKPPAEPPASASLLGKRKRGDDEADALREGASHDGEEGRDTQASVAKSMSADAAEARRETGAGGGCGGWALPISGERPGQSAPEGEGAKDSMHAVMNSFEEQMAMIRKELELEELKGKLERAKRLSLDSQAERVRSQRSLDALVSGRHVDDA